MKKEITSNIEKKTNKKPSRSSKLCKKLIYCTICGPSNVGKSTFLNKVLEKNIAPVSNKVQTTRFSIKGALNQGDTQIVFTDTPGVFNLKNGILEKKIVQNAWSDIKFTDLLMIMTDANTKIDNNTKKIINNAKHNGIEFFIAINKSDQKKVATRIEMIDSLIKEYGEDIKIFCISAIDGTNISAVLEYIKKKAYEGEWIFEESITNISLDKIISEKVRGYFFSFLKEEIPYQIETAVENYIENENEIKVSILLFYTKESYKGILIGKNGNNIKGCIKTVCLDLASFTNKKITLNIRAKLNEKWKENWEMLDNFYNKM